MKKFKTTFTTTFLMVLIFLSQGCSVNGVNTLSGDGNVQEKHYEIDEFNSLKLGGSLNIVLTEGDKPGLIVETDENLHPHINIESEDKVLNIYSNRDIVLRPTKLNIYITYTSLEKILTSGASKITTETLISSESFILEISGACSGELHIETENLKTDVSGAASIRLKGTASLHNITLSGASSLKAEELITEKTVIRLSGAGSATIYASEDLDATLSGVGSIKYAGDPKTKNTNVSGIGKISSID